MKVLFDTSALIASFIETHPNHLTASIWLEKALVGSIEYYVSSHTVFETYSVLTRTPFRPKISPSAARKLIEENIYHKANLVSLNNKEILSLLIDIEKRNFIGGIVFDAIIVECALKVNVDKIITGNSRHFLHIVQTKKNTIEIIPI